MKREALHLWIFVGLIAATMALAAIVGLALPAPLSRWSGLAMGAWITVAGLVAGRVWAITEGRRFWPAAFKSMALFGWVALMFCCPAWKMMLFQPNSSMFTVLFPVSLPPALRTLWSRGRTAPTTAPRTMLVTIAVIALFHLVWFFPTTTSATKAFLALLLVVSIAATRIPDPYDAQARSAEPPG